MKFSIILKFKVVYKNSKMFFKNPMTGYVKRQKYMIFIEIAHVN